jgi:hypothetical protein
MEGRGSQRLGRRKRDGGVMNYVTLSLEWGWDYRTRRARPKANPS